LTRYTHMHVLSTTNNQNFTNQIIKVQYFHDHATVTSAVGLNQSPAVLVTATVGSPSFAFGEKDGYHTSMGALTKYNADISVTSPDYKASIILSDKGDTISAAYVHHLDVLKRTSGVAEVCRKFSSNENTITVGGSYAVDPLTSVKYMLNNHGKLAALMQHELKLKSFFTLSGEFDTKALDKAPRFGLSLTLKP
ncbi:hypothetical protein MKX01_013709, partial [Papaver californicum]